MNPSVRVTRAPKRKLIDFKRLYQCRYLYLIIALPVIWYIVFCYVPMGGIVIGFQKYNARKGIAGSDWVGLKYFLDFLTDPYFWKVVRNTFVINVYDLLIGFPVPIIFALLLNEINNSKFKRLTQTVTYMPHFISTVVICGMLHMFFASDGPVNQVRNALGMETINFLLKPQYFRGIYVGSGIWQGVGWGSIIYLAALAGIDTEQYEAAIIDGANRFQRTIYITIPGIMGTISIMLIMRMGSMLSVGFEKVLLLYNGATYETADVISTYVYRRGVISADFAYGTAMDLFNSVVGLVFVLTSNIISKKLGGSGIW